MTAVRDADPSWREPRKPKPAPTLVHACGHVHAYRDHKGEWQRCGFCCGVHREEKAK